MINDGVFRTTKKLAKLAVYADAINKAMSVSDTVVNLAGFVLGWYEKCLVNEIAAILKV